MSFKNIVIKPDIINMTMYASQGDIGSVIAMQKLIELRNVVAFANKALSKTAMVSDLITKFSLYRSAILDYNSCDDYIFQTIYFGFDFCSKIETSKQYLDQLQKDCVRKVEDPQSGKFVPSPYVTKISELKNTNINAKEFFRKYKKFRNALRKSNVDISDWANRIKHRGGFLVEELMDKSKMARVIITSNDDTTLFDSSLVFLPTTFQEIERRLEEQNKIIIEFVNYLQDSIFGDTQNISDINVSNKLFSANGYNYSDQNGNTYLTSLE